MAAFFLLIWTNVRTCVCTLVCVRVRVVWVCWCADRMLRPRIFQFTLRSNSCFTLLVCILLLSFGGQRPALLLFVLFFHLFSFLISFVSLFPLASDWDTENYFIIIITSLVIPAASCLLCLLCSKENRIIDHVFWCLFQPHLSAVLCARYVKWKGEPSFRPGPPTVEKSKLLSGLNM